MLIAIASQELGSWIFGGLTLLFLIAVFCFGPERLPEWKRRLLGIVCAVSAGLFGFFFTGAITLKLESEVTDYSRIAIQAIGGFALFVFVLWWWGRRDKYGKRRNGSQPFEQGPVVSRAIELAEAKGRAEEQIEQLKTELAKAVERIKKLQAEGNRPDAEKALEELRESGDMMRLQELLIQDRDEHRDALIQRNREIAAVAYLRGDIDIAIEAIDEILKELPEDLFALNQMGHIHKLRGKLKDAEDCYRRVLELGSDRNYEGVQAVALCNLGLIYKTRGDLDKADEMHRKSLEIEKKLGRPEGIARQYGNLGSIYLTRGELDKAERAFLKILKIHEELDDKEAKAIDYLNLGLIYRKQGDLDNAEEMHLKSLEIDKKLGRIVGMANNYAALGLVHYDREDLGTSEKMHIKGLEIEKKLGRLEGMARQYSNLGLVYVGKGELDKAVEMHRDSLKIYEKLSDLGGIASNYGNLGVVYINKGELDKAEQMHRKSLEINEKVGLQEGMAIDYANLGLIYKQREDIGTAREYWEKALELYKRIGIPHMVKKWQGLIEGLKDKKSS